VAAWPDQVRRRLRQLWTDRDRMVALTESAERTWCHLDAWPANLAAPARATVLGVLAVVLVALYVVTAGLVRQLTVLNVGPTSLIILIYVAVGVIVARRQPGNPVGWIVRG
jgi:antibiotic biosynthesis monooxygenase (ABM) superfamily enzyme